jgi:DNA-binding NarL/FixJ family response regulator
MYGNDQLQHTGSRCTGKPKILIVDDDPSSIEVMFEVLGNDYEILCATRGSEGIVVAGDALPDIILLDILMDDMDGFEVCARLKDSPRTAHIPIIFLTGLDASAEEVKGFEAGAIDYVTKPIDASVVRARVRTQVGLSKQLSELLRSRQNQESVDTSNLLHAELTFRQQEVLRWLCEGKSNWEISKILGIGENTTKYHIRHIYSRLNVVSRAQAMTKFLYMKNTEKS